jgi:polar amino acid transport system substrate-binding protein
MTLEIKNMEFGSIIAAVDSGKIDMGMAGMTVTDERLQTVNFSKSYATGIQVVIVKEESEITSVDDLTSPGGYTIGVQTATTGDL